MKGKRRRKIRREVGMKEEGQRWGGGGGGGQRCRGQWNKMLLFLLLSCTGFLLTDLLRGRVPSVHTR